MGLASSDSAITYAKRCQVLPLLAHSYGIKSGLYRDMGRMDMWIITLDSAIATSVKMGNLNQAAYGLLDKFKFLKDEKRYPEALKAGGEVMAILEKGEQKPLLRNTYKAFYEVYKGMGKPELALGYLEKYILVKDSLENVEFKNQVHEINTKYEVAAKDKKLLEDSLALKNSHFVQVLMAAFVLLLGSIAYFFYYRMKNHQRSILELFQKERNMEKEISWLRKLLQEDVSTQSEGSESSSSSDSKQSAQLVIRAQTLMSKEKLYLDPEFSRNSLAQLLGTNKDYLSQALNESEDGGFRSFINKYRIDEAKSILWRIARKTADIPLNEIWQHTGFGSNQAFYRVFKGITQLTPKEYLDQVIKEIHKQ